MSSLSRFGIVVGGGPAPGINGVIGAATTHALRSGHEVLGLRDGFSWLMAGDTAHAEPLSAESVRSIHLRGGSVLGISRANPTKDPAKLEQTLATLDKLGVDKLVSIGGDDTAFSAYSVSQKSGGRVRVVHVPKTIDNDLDLPNEASTFGFQTARHHGVKIVESLMADAETTKRWYLVIAMGRHAGHLALGIGKAAGAPVSLIAEEFPAGVIKLATIVDTLAGAVLKRAAEGAPYGVAVLAEGLVERLDPADLESLKDVERDAHGHVRIAEVPFGDIVKAALQKRLEPLGQKVTFVAKNIGYELRCVDPVPFDMEYTRELGYAAAQFLLDGGSGAMVSVQSGKLVPMPFASILDPKTNKMRVRMVDVGSDRFRVARAFMTRLQKADFDDAARLDKLAKGAKVAADVLKKEFAHVAL